MAAWLIPALKAVLPHVGTIISTAAPVFTSKKVDAVAGQSVLQQQITELQSAASRNAAQIKELASQLQETLTALEKAATMADARLRNALVYCALASLLSVAALGVAFYAVLLRVA